jgi:DNA-binding transcriptional LysR family regulator
MNIQQIRQFTVVAKTGSITKASEKLFISHQALSKSMNNLEWELGASLLARTAGGVQLTELGREILPIAECMLAKRNEYLNLIFSLTEQGENTVTISIEHKFLLYAIPPELISSLKDSMKVNLTIAGNYEKCADDVLHNRVDMALCHKNKAGEGLEYIPFISEPLMVVMRKDHYLANKTTLTIKDMQNTSLCLASSANDSMEMAYVAACSSEGFYPDIAFRSSDLNMLVRTALARKLAIPTASFALSEISLNHLEVRPLIHDSLKIEAGFLTRRGSAQKPLVQSYINAVLQYYS